MTVPVDKGPTVFLSTAVATVYGNNQKVRRKINILMDSGSHRTYATNKLIKDL